MGVGKMDTKARKQTHKGPFLSRFRIPLEAAAVVLLIASVRCATPAARPPPVFAAPPSRLLRPLPYGRDIVVYVDPKRREGAEDRIAGAALRLGGIVERIERGPVGAAPGAAGTVRVILPESAATRFLEEMDRIGTIPPEGKPAATDLPAGPRPGTVAYAVRIRVR